MISLNTTEIQTLLPYLTDEEREELEMLIAPSPDDETWQEWLARHFPGKLLAFAPHHERAWAWIDALRPGVKPPALVECWARGGGKSSTVEFGVGRVSAKLSRRYALYVCGTQDKANDHVASIASLLEKLGVKRAVNTYGASRGWRRQQLRTSQGFNVAGFGLDTGMRGAKLDEYRPDWIILDDVDELTDSLQAIERKISIITSTILPSGSSDCAVSFVQNAIHRESVMSRMIDGRADFLRDRSPVVPVPALQEMEVAEINGRYVITQGEPTWVGQDVETCEAQVNEWGLEAFVREAQHEVHAASKNAYFNTEVVTRWLNEVRGGMHTPIESLRFDVSAASLERAYQRGELQVWETPIPGRRYVVTADPAGGVNTDGLRDYSSCDVIDAETHAQAAHLHGHWEPALFAEMINSLGREYNLALVAALRLNHGGTVLSHLLNDHNYPAQRGRGFSGVYYYDASQVFGQARQQDARAIQPGWPEDVRTKPWMLDSLAREITQEVLIVRSEQTLQELLTFVNLPGGKAGADTGAHDDCVSSLAVGCAVLRLRGALQDAEEYEPIEPVASVGFRGGGRY